MIDKALIAYATMSGNTEEVAELIEDELINLDKEADIFFIDLMNTEEPPDLSEYSRIYIGTYTWDFGAAPDEMMDFIIDLGDVDIPVLSFGTGETQFGDDLYCIAVDNIANHFNSLYKVLKIEQSPRGSQEHIVRQWVKSTL